MNKREMGRHFDGDAPGKGEGGEVSRKELNKEGTADQLPKPLKSFEHGRRPEKEGRIQEMRLRLLEEYKSKAIPLDPDSKELIANVTQATQEKLESNFEPGFGVFPTADPN